MVRENDYNRKSRTQINVQSNWNATTGDAFIKNKPSDHIKNVKDYGVIGDGVTNDQSALQILLNLGGNLYMPSGTYLVEGLTVDVSQTSVTGDNENTIIKCTANNDVLTVNINSYFSNIWIQGGGVSKSGAMVNKGCSFDRVHISNNTEYGIAFSSTIDIVNAFFNDVVTSYNTLGGVYISSDGSSQKNNIRFDKLYSVKNGTDADNLTSDGTPTNGHGIYIDGGLGISFYGTVSEYNTGAGLYIDQASGYTLRGLVVEGTYFEQNKYAHILVDFINANWNGIRISQSIFQDPSAHVGNSLIPTDGNVAFVTNNYMPEDVIIEQNSRLENANIASAEKTTLKPNEYMTRDYGAYKGHISSTHASGTGNSCLVIDADFTSFIEYERSNYTVIDPTQDYLIELNYTLNLDGTGNGAMYVDMLLDDGTVDSAATQLYLVPGQVLFFRSQPFLIPKANFSVATRKIRFRLGIANGITANSYFLINSLKVIPIDIQIELSGVTADRPLKLEGIRYFDTTLGMPLWTDGTNWLNATGSTALSALVAKTSDYTITAFDSIILIDATSNTVTATLPTSNAGKRYTIKCIDDTYTATIDGGGTIDGETSQTINQWESIELMSNGSAWLII